MIIGNLTRLQATNRAFELPWNSNPSAPGDAQDPFKELTVRDTLRQEREIDITQTNGYVSKSWGLDVDPSPQRVLRRTVEEKGVSFAFEMSLDQEGKQPLESTLRRSDGELLRSATYKDGELVHVLERRPHAGGLFKSPYVESLEISINPDGTLSYSEKSK
jgi:hypothetical protein